MSNRPEITQILSLSIQKHINPNNDTRIYYAKEVTFDYATGDAIRVDFMKFSPFNNTVSGIEKGDFYCYEVKSSIEDFHSKNGHNFIGDFNYYVMPEDVFEKVKNEIPYHVGVFIPDGKHYGGEWYNLKSIKKAKRKDRERPIFEMLLMMFRSATRERISDQKKKIIKCKQTDCVYEHCCVECDSQKSRGGICGCNICEDLSHDKALILKECKHAELAE